MNSKKLLKIIISSTFGLTAIASFSGVLISCGSKSYSQYNGGTYTFKADISSSNQKTGNIDVWIPFKVVEPAQNPTTKKWDCGNYGYAVEKFILQSLADAKLIKDFSFDDKDTHKFNANGIDFWSPSSALDTNINHNSTAASYEGASGAIRSLIRGKNIQKMPDIILNYPDTAATLSSYGLLQPFDTKAEHKVADAVAPAFQKDITSVIGQTDNETVLPLAKSSQLLAFDTPFMCKVFYDIATAMQSSGQETISVYPNSAQDRMLRMLTSNATLNDNKVKFEDIYDDKFHDWKQPDSKTGFTVYYTKDIIKVWESKIADNGIWNNEIKVINKNYLLRNTPDSEQNLIDLGSMLGKSIFDSYDGLGYFVNKLWQIYAPYYDSSDMTKSAYIYGENDPVNDLWTYQFDLGNHKENNFFINQDSQNPNIVNFNLRNDYKGNNLRMAYNYMQTLFSTGVVAGKPMANNQYTNFLADQHKAPITMTSSAGAFSYGTTGKDIGDLLPGETYFEVQPNHVGTADSDKNTIINQGPSLFISKVRAGDLSQNIANAMLDGFNKYGGANVSNSADSGMWSQYSYIYADKNTYYNNDQYSDILSKGVESSLEWAYNISKYLLLNYVKSSTVDNGFLMNPVTPYTSTVRTAMGNAFNVLMSNKDWSKPYDSFVDEQIANAVTNGSFVPTK